MYAYHCAQLSYTTTHRTVLINFPPNLQTSLITGGNIFIKDHVPHSNLN